ncbi:MAG: bifunctional phosphopantothenoylcysteine decarboxylase/phosphopantothenate--cysteine ligase CoaBC [Cryomorphaceae bacterium]
MGFLQSKRILLGVTGSIAAYKSAFIIRELVKAGAEVQVLLTPSARQFVTPVTLSTLSKRPVLDALIKDDDTGEWNNHVQLGIWADAMLIAPTSANTLAKMAHGDADNLLLTTFLSAKCPVFFAPAMDLDMHASASNQANIKTLESRGFVHIPSAAGELASGLEGTGRMAEPEDIILAMENFFASKAPLRGKKVLVTAGPTREPIDPVRFIGNRSSGKMGYAIAEAAAQLGADVSLVSGPVSLTAPGGLRLINVETAAEMYDATNSVFEDMDIAVFSAAVADYRPATVADQKIKKSDKGMQIEMEKTVDILQTLGAKKKKGQIIVGFALETENELENAKGKLERKNCDLIVLNSLRDQGAGFGGDKNKVTLVTRNKTQEEELKPKNEIARDILNFIMREFIK